MNTIRYGNLSVELTDGGTRITRLNLRPDPAGLFLPRDPGPLPSPRILGREQAAAEALRAIAQGRPIGFWAACGYGKTTLLQHITVRAAQRYGAARCVYLRADRGGVDDLLQQAVTRLYQSDLPVKLTPGECAHLLGRSGLVLAVDDAPADPAQAGYLADVLSGCTLVLASDRRVAIPGGDSHELTGLPASTALELLATVLGRPLASDEIAAAGNLVTAVKGQPLHLRQAAALVRDGSHTIASLAAQAAADPAVLDRLSVNALCDRDRRILAVLALTAGALLPEPVVTAIGQAAAVGESLALLHRRGLAERRRDRFGLPACKAESYRAMLLSDLELGGAGGGLGRWLAEAGAASGDLLPGADAALAILEFAAERQEWATVVQLARAVEQTLFLAKRWQAWHHLLGQGLAAAKAGAASAEAYFAHQLGSLELCLDHLDEAARLLRDAQALREQAGDTDGATLSRQNLEQIEPPDPPPPPQPSRPSWRRWLSGLHPAAVALATMLSVLGLLAGSMEIARALGGGGPDPVTTPTSPASTKSSQHTKQSHGTNSHGTNSHGTNSGGTNSQGTNSGSPGGTGGTGTSSGPTVVTVPNVIGKSQVDATTILQNAGLAASAVGTHCLPLGTVGDQNPRNPGTVSRGSTVTIDVCGPSLVTVPTVLNESQDDATAALQNAGLTASSVPTTNCGSVEPGYVADQNPEGGALVGADSPVTIYVCQPVTESPSSPSSGPSLF